MSLPQLSVRRVIGWTLFLAAAIAAVIVPWRYRRFLDLFREPEKTNLRVVAQQGTLKLTWNPASQAVSESTVAVVQIVDGTRRKDIPLKTADLRRGFLLYQPETNRVDFQLSLDSGDNEDVLASGFSRAVPVNGVADRKAPSGLPMPDFVLPTVPPERLTSPPSVAVWAPYVERSARRSPARRR